ncbi:25382_t:CDS:2, partial [Dentiscutata erythropus]
ALDKPQLGLINPQNRDDNECFKWCISANHTREEAIKNNRKPLHLNEILFSKAFGKIKVDIDPLFISEQNYQIEHMIDLLYLTEGEENLNNQKNPNDIPEGLKTHYVFITNFIQLMHKWNNHHDKKYFCQKCLRFPYSRLDLLEKHIPTCPGPNKALQRLILPEEEAEEAKVEEKDKEGNTIKIAKQKAVSYRYTIHCSDGTIQKPRKYQIENKCKNCEGKLHEAGYNKIRIFDPETKKYLGAGYRKCHGKKPMIQGKLDDEQKKARGACKKSKVTDEKIVPIANNSEQYITFSVGQLQFIDSMKFSLLGLAKIAENLQDEKKGENKTPEQLAKCFLIMSKFISPHLLSLLTHFNSDLDGFNYYNHNCRIEKCKHGKKKGKCKHKCQKCKHKKEPEIQHKLQKRWEIQVLKSYKLELEKDKKIKKVLKQYSDDEELQGYMEYSMELKYYTELLETTKKQVEIERCMLTNGMLYGQEREIVKYNIQQIADEIIPWGDIYEDWDIDELLAKI